MDERRRSHGYDLAPELHARLRGVVPTEALSWVERESGSWVVGQTPLEGGTSSAVHLLTVRDRYGMERRMVLRRYVLDWVRDEPWAPGNEALALDLLDLQPGIPAPRLLAVDRDGSRAGTPAVLMSVVRGSAVWEPTDREGWLWSLAEQLPVIHAVPVDDRLSEWAPYGPDAPIPPAWSRHPEAWNLALELWEAGPPPHDRVFLHRDYHPGNVLWTGGQVTGIVDWVSACAGPPEEDVAHCRANLASRHGLAVADRFLEIWLDLTGRDGFDPYYDLTVLVSMTAMDSDPGIDDFIAAAAAARRG